MLTTIDWKSYGLVLGRVVDQGGNVMLEWENLPPRSHIDMVIHCYHKQYPIFHINHSLYGLAFYLFVFIGVLLSLIHMLYAMSSLTCCQV